MVSDTLIAIRPTDGSPVGKSVTRGPDGKLKKSMFSGARAEWWTAVRHPVDDIYSLFRVLKELETRPDFCVIRGEPRPGVDISRPHKRRTKHSAKDGHPPAYDDCGRRWVGIDIDNLPYDPARFDPYGEPEEFFEWLTGTISDDLEGVSCVYQFSTGAGIIDDGKKHNIIKVHLWFWLDRPYTCVEIKRWANAINSVFEANLPAKPGEKVVQLIDTTPIQPVGILYTAAPFIGEGVSTAVIRRLGIVDLEREAATLQIPEGVRGSIAIHSPLRGAPPVNSGLDLEDRLALIGDGPGLLGFHQAFTSIVGYYFHEKGAEADQQYIKERIIEAALARENDREPGVVRTRLGRLDDIISNIQGSQAHKEATGAFVRSEKREVRESDLSAPFYPYPDIPSAGEGASRQKRVIGAWFDQAIRRAVRRKLEDEGDGETDCGVDDSAPLKLQITGPVGSGKTTAVEEVIRDSAAAVLASIEGAEDVSLNIFFCSGLTEKAAETADAIPGAIALRGVGADDPEIDGRKMCWRSDMASKVQASQGILSAICQQCRFRSNCGYRAQARSVQEAEERTGVRVFTGPHEFLHYPSQVRWPWDIVIVDERYKAEQAKASKGLKILAAPLDWSGFVYVPKDVDPEPEKPTDANGRLKVRTDPGFVDAVRKTIRKAIKGNEHRLLAAIRDAEVPGFMARVDKETVRTVRNFLTWAFEQSKPFDPETGVPKFNTRAEDAAIIELIEDETDHRLAFLARFFDNLYREWDAEREQANTIRIESNKIVLRGYKEPTKVAKAAPVLLLDATAKLDLNRKIWGADLVEERINIENRVSAIQLIRQSWSKASLVDGEGKATTKAVEVARIINRFPRSFVAAPKAVREALEPHLGETILAGHYAKLRGLNAFSDCKTGFVLCDPMVPPIAVLDLALAYGANDRDAYYLPEYIEEVRRFRMRDPKEVVTSISPVAAHPVLETYREILVDDEMLQAIGRVRGFWNERTVYILSNRVYDQTLDRVEPWEEFAYGRKDTGALIERSPEFVVDSPAWVCRRFPEITRTPATASKILADLQQLGWKPSGWQVKETVRGNVFDLLSLGGQGALLSPHHDIAGEGYSMPSQQLCPAGEAADFPTMLVMDLIERGWVSLSPDWIIAEFGEKYGRRATINSELKRLTPELLPKYIHFISNQFLRWPFSSHCNQTNSSPEAPSNQAKPVFGRFKYRREGQRRPSHGLYYGTEFRWIMGRLESELGPLSACEEVAVYADANVEADTAITRANAIASQTGVTKERDEELNDGSKHILRDIYESIEGRSLMPREEIARREAERASNRAAKREREEYEADIVEEAIIEEADAAAIAGVFDLNKAAGQA